MIEGTDIPMLATSVGGAGVGVWALLRWSLARMVEKEDAANKRRDGDIEGLGKNLRELDSRLHELDARLGRIEGRFEAVNHDIGKLETEHARTLGRVDGLQSDWRSRFEKLEAELRQRDERITDMVHEAKAESAKGVADLRVFLEEYRLTVHERLNEITRLIIEAQQEKKETSR